MNNTEKASGGVGLVTIALLVFSILLSTGVWKPTSNFFLWSWLTFHCSFPGIVVPILTILFGSTVIALCLALIVVIAIVLIGTIAGLILKIKG